MIGIDSYLYQAAVPFEGKHIGNNYTLSLAFNHSTLGSDFRFADRYMRVLKKAALSQPGQPGATGIFDESKVTVIGNITPNRDNPGLG